MKPVTARLAAGAAAISVTLTLVWSLAALAYPAPGAAKVQLACYPANSSATLSVR
jgi:hypothetical protein